VSDVESPRQVARHRAVEDAQACAGQLADAAPLRLGPILSIEEVGVRGVGSPFAARALERLPVEPGSAWTTVMVTVTFGLED
jgi:uncharacterized protein YggE